jgi:hypothetical protein
VADLAPEVPVAGGDYAHIDAAGPGAAHGAHVPLLEGAQKFGLERTRSLAHLVEKERTPVGGLVEALFLAVRPGEGTFE